MEIHRMKPENPIIIVDEKESEQIDAISRLKEEEVEQLAQEKFLRYVKDCGISMCLRINGVDRVIHQGVITELNYDERGWPESVVEKVKHNIVDDVKQYINKHFEHYKEDCRELLKHDWDIYKKQYDKKIKFWKYLFIVSFLFLMVECVCRIIQ